MNHCSRSPGWRSQLNVWFFRCSRRMPPCPWTIGFGSPSCRTRRGRTTDGRRAAVERERPARREQVVPRHRVPQRVVLATDVRDVDDGAERRQPRPHLRHLLAPVDELVAVAVAATANSTVGWSWPSRLRTLRGPNSGGHVAQMRRGSPRRGRRRASPGRSGGTRRPGHRAARRAPAGRRAPVPPARAGRRTSARSAHESASARRPRASRVLVPADHVLSAVDERTGKPLGARHLARAEHALVWRVCADLEEVPDGAPEPSRSEIDQRWSSSYPEKSFPRSVLNHST